MPTYEFECPKCSNRFEQRRSFTDESKVKCPKCQQEARRVFSPVPIIFKGSGFYVTDNKGEHGHSAPVNAGSDKVAPADTSKPKAGSAEAKSKTTD